MTNELSKTEYLKRYLEGDKKGKKKKKPKTHNPLIPRMKIVDQDIGIKSMSFDEKVEVEEEDAPLVAEVIDDRPEEVKIKELYESSRWKKLDSGCGDEAGNTQESESNTLLRKQSKLKRHDSNSDCSPPQRTVHSRTRHDSDNDISPPRISTSKKRHDSDNDICPSRNSISSKKRHDSDSDCSPPRRKTSTKGDCRSPPTKRRRDSDCDLSPPRRSRKEHSTKKASSVSKRKKHDSDSDLSPERVRTKLPYKQQGSDSDISPPRRRGDAPRPTKTLSGLSAGLQSAATLRDETKDLRSREKKEINMMNAELSGRNAETVLRDRNTGKRRDLEQEKKEKDEQEKKASEMQQKYAAWGKGIEQTENKKKNFEQDLYEMSKPLARYCDDEDLEERLKNVIHDDDPMAEYVKKKRKNENVSTMPVYSGPPPPPNRFGIMPGYRWDGVDRSNGFEKKIFEKNSSTKANQEEAYLWSVQNM